MYWNCGVQQRDSDEPLTPRGSFLACLDGPESLFCLRLRIHLTHSCLICEGFLFEIIKIKYIFLNVYGVEHFTQSAKLSVVFQFFMGIF